MAVLDSCAATPSTPSPTHTQSATNLTRVQTSQVDALYVAPGASLLPYSKVLIDPVDVTFQRDWMRRHPEVDSEDAAKVRGRLSASFSDVFTHELAKTAKYTIVYQAGPDVLRVHAAILDLDVSAPSVIAPTNENRYVVSPGEMTLLLELYDSRAGALLARAVDRKKGRETGSLEIANADTNAAASRQAFTAWADTLRDALDAARETSTAKAPVNEALR